MPLNLKRKTVETVENENKPAKFRGCCNSVVPKRLSKKPSKQFIDDANALPIRQFRERYVDAQDLVFSAQDHKVNVKINLKSATELSPSELNSCFSLIESTSRKDYEGSANLGWHPKRKKREMKEAEMRYFIVEQTNKSTSASEGETGNIDGFLSVMLTHDSSPLVPVLYIYEIHLAENLRGIGLGLRLIKIAEKLAAKVGVKKVMLTCFLSNEKALRFYEDQGFIVDESSPQDRVTRHNVVKAEYAIMSKLVQAAPELG